MAFRHTVVIVAALAASVSAFAIPASADETGLAAIHTWMKVGRKTCFTDHMHVGNSSGKSSKRTALKAAIVSWEEFTAAEYGTDWAYFRNAIKKMKGCSKDYEGWGCTVEATPCRPR